MNRWYAAHTHSQSEETAVSHLSRQGFDVFLPRYRRRVSHARKVTWKRAALFPRYLFVNIDLDAERWRAINSTIGVQHLVLQGEAPAPVAVGVIETIQAHENTDGIVDFSRDLNPGDRVLITEGPFIDQIGVLERLSDKDKVVVLLSLLGRDTMVGMSGTAVQPAA